MNMSPALPTLDTVETPVEQLKSSIQGDVFLPTSPAYDEARLAWNRKVEQHPALIVDAQCADDVVRAVTFANEQEMELAVQATGHGNVRPADGCLLILTRKMTAVEIDAATQTASVEAGVKWGAVLAAAQGHGLAPLLGSSPTVGAVGYTLGGGLGWLGRKYGLSLDNVVAFDVVTMDGQLRRASTSEHSDLFWGLRGGGGSLGIVTSMTIRLFPVSEVYAGNLFYPVSMARSVFQHYRQWIETAPDELTSSVLVMNYPPVPQLPDFLRGQSFVLVRGCYSGDIAEGERLLAHWRSWQAPLVDDFKTIPFSAAATISADPVDPMPAFNTGAWLHALTDEAIDAIVDYATGRGNPSPLIFAEVRHAGGAIRRQAADGSVYGNRDAELLLSLVGVVPTTEAQAQLVHYTDELKSALRPALTGGVYMNFLEGEESRQRIRDGLRPGGYEQLARLKGRYDPDNRLRYGFNVTPTDSESVR